MTSLDESVRLLSPHALGNDGFRWHMRAFCHKRQRFSDFVLARILRIDGFEASQVDASQDSHWQTVLTLVLAPHPDLPAAKKRVLELDYGMEGGQVKLPCRQAFLYYTLRRLGLHTKEAPDPLAQQITLKTAMKFNPILMPCRPKANTYDNIFELVKDPYERKARVIPGLLVALPLLVPLLCVYGAKHPVLTGVIGLLGGCGAIYALASVARGRGKKLKRSWLQSGAVCRQPSRYAIATSFSMVSASSATTRRSRPSWVSPCQRQKKNQQALTRQTTSTLAPQSGFANSRVPTSSSC
jgi:hypothetical protein